MSFRRKIFLAEDVCGCQGNHERGPEDGRDNLSGVDGFAVGAPYLGLPFDSPISQVGHMKRHLSPILGYGSGGLLETRPR